MTETQGHWGMAAVIFGILALIVLYYYYVTVVDVVDIAVTAMTFDATGVATITGTNSTFKVDSANTLVGKTIYLYTSSIPHFHVNIVSCTAVPGTTGTASTTVFTIVTGKTSYTGSPAYKLASSDMARVHLS